MRIKVDQSGKVENTQTDTVLAFSNGRRYSIVVPAALKREWFRRKGWEGKSKRASYLTLFSAGLFLLLRRFVNKNITIVIDKEYPGYDLQIRLNLLNYFEKRKIPISKEQITFDFVGRGCAAHELANAVFKERAKASKIVTGKELFAV